MLGELIDATKALTIFKNEMVTLKGAYDSLYFTFLGVFLNKSKLLKCVYVYTFVKLTSLFSFW